MDMDSINDFLHNEWSNQWFETMKLNKNINWKQLSTSNNLTTDIVMSNLDKNWNLKEVNKHLSFDEILKISTTKKLFKGRKEKYYEDYQFLNWYEISKSKNITIEMMIANRHLPWKWNSVLLNPNLKTSHVIENPKIQWDFNDYHMYYKINDIELIKQNLSIKWNWKLLSCSASMNDIVNNLKLPWDWHYVTYNPNLTIDVICNNLDKNWNLITLLQRGNSFYNSIFDEVDEDYEVSDDEFEYSFYGKYDDDEEFTGNPIYNDNVIHFKISKKHIDDSNYPIKFSDIFKLKYKELLTDPRHMVDCKWFTFDMLLENFEKSYVKWNWKQISSSNIVTLDVIQQHPNLPWDWAVLSAKKYDNDDYLNSQKLSISLATILWFYDGLKVCENVVDGDKILSDSYLVKMICKFIS